NTVFRAPVESDLALVTGARRSYDYNYWQELKLWPRRPDDVYYCWLHIARELRRRNARYPQFMDGITDLGLIEDQMAAWERESEIARWKDRLHSFEPPESAPDAGALELRLVLHPCEARLQWRAGPAAAFADFKQSHARRFSEQFERGDLSLSPESLPLWSAVFKPWQHESWWSFKYDNSAARPALSRLLRLPLSPDRVVTPDNQPLSRGSGPLRLRLRPPENGGADYEIALVAADGSPPPKILCALAGRPTLYLTEGGLFPGPPADALDTGLRETIPAPALETPDGLRFLRATGIPLPEHLAQRVRTVPVNVTISCELKPVYAGAQSENIIITALARAPGMRTEKFTPRGWEETPDKNGDKKLKLEKGAIPVHDRAPLGHFPRLLETLGVKWDGCPEQWKLRLTKKTPDSFVPWLNSLPPEIEVLLDRELASLRHQPVSGRVSLDVTESAVDWFDLKIVLNVADTTLTPEELKLLLNARGGYVRLGGKGWRRLQFNLTSEEDQQLARLGLNPRDFSDEPQRFHALQLADDAAKKFLAPDRVEKIQRRVGELKARVAPALPQGIRALMRPYQMDGYHFLACLTENRFGGVLADDMGLGKTLQALAWLAWLRDRAAGGTSGAPLPSLVVCPKSVTDNWRAEAERFYPGLRVRLWRGEPSEELCAAREAADLIVINYSQLRLLGAAIGGTQWLAAILDEAQYIKNPDSQTARAARALQAGHRLALTGTPIENRLLDLWSILAFAMPGALGNRAHFLRRFNAQDDPLARRRLAARVRPFLFRRTKAQVAQDLPDRVEEDLLCEMEGVQRTLYHAELKRARQIILGLQTNQQLNDQRFHILTSLLRLRQICCHPGLVDGKLRGAESAKVAGLLDLLEPLMEEGHKVLVFSQFVTMLDLLRDTVRTRQWPHLYLAGDTENRGELVEKFQSAAGGAVFLISLKAGGFGLNLTAASYVVLFDPWWNPAVESQAIDRTHRIGQTRKVMAYRLLVRDSIEQKIRALQQQKAALMDDVLGEERFAQTLTLEDLRLLFAE
ncbi:MAG: DEAD/DEAH box helicase, partial [Verrucomicrobiota bacterium]